MTKEQIELGRHALGLPNNQKTSYRNHFVAGVGHSDFDDWTLMVEQGNAKRRKGNAISGGDDVFWLTEQGARACLKQREKLREEDFPKSSAERREGR